MVYLEQSAGGETRKIPLDPNSVTYIGVEGDYLTVVPESGNPIAALYASKRNFVLVGQSDVALFVNYRKVTLLKIIREGDQVASGSCTAIFRELVIQVLPPDSSVIEKLCLVCRAPFKEGERVVFCPACHIPQHERCWDVMQGRCANGLFCPYQAPWPRKDAAAK